MAATRYRAFISYSHRDRAWADWLHKALESYAVPGRLVGRQTGAGVIPSKLTPVFRDRDELASATDLTLQVNEALAQSANLVVICSPDAARSRWVNEEILAFKRLGRSDRIFCLIVAGEPNTGDVAGLQGNECFAPALRFALGDDGALGTQRAEPVAADARPGMDGRADAKLKLIAGMLWIGLDELKQREQQRRYRRMSAIAAFSVLVMTVTSVLGVMAVVAQHAAERRQQQAEDLVDYMLGDLDDKLREVNRLDILEGVADKAMQYFASLPASDATDQAAAERAKALQKIGSIRLDQGQLQPALESFQAASALNRKLASAHPADSAVQLQLAQSIAFTGMVRWQQGQGVEADKSFTQAQHILEQALRQEPQSVDLLAELANQITNNGRLLESADELDAAAGKYREVLEIYQRLSTLQSEQSQWPREIGYANNNLGKLAATRGQLLEAARYYQTDLTIKQALSRDDPDNNQAREDVATALLFMADIRNQTGDSGGARDDAKAALLLIDQLVRFDPAQSSFTYLDALGKKLMAVILLDLGEPRQAAVYNRQSQLLLAELLDAEPDNLRRRLRQFDGQLLAADIALALGERSEARRLAREMLSNLAAVPATEADPKELVRLHTLALIRRAQTEDVPGVSRAYWTQARDRLAPLMAGSMDPKLLQPWVQIAIALGTQPFPGQSLQRLQQAGYAKPGFVALLKQAGIDHESRGPGMAPNAIAGSNRSGVTTGESK